MAWADGQKNPHLIEFWRAHAQNTVGKSALVIGCGLGDDAEQLAAWGYRTTALDISETAFRSAQKRFSGSVVDYVVADLLAPPREWAQKFDFVLEVYPVEALPIGLRSRTIERVASFVKPGVRCWSWPEGGKRMSRWDSCRSLFRERSWRNLAALALKRRASRIILMAKTRQNAGFVHCIPGLGETNAAGEV